MFIQAPTTRMMARARPSQAQIVRSMTSAATLPPGLSMKRMNTKSSVRMASAAVIIDDVTPTSRLMFAMRSACHTIRARSSSPARKPIPCHMLSPPKPSTSNQLKNETIKRTMAAPSTIFAPVVSSLNLSIFRRFLSEGWRILSHSSAGCGTDTNLAARLLSPQAVSPA